MSNDLEQSLWRSHDRLTILLVVLEASIITNTSPVGHEALATSLSRDDAPFVVGTTFVQESRISIIWLAVDKVTLIFHFDRGALANCALSFSVLIRRIFSVHHIVFEHSTVAIARLIKGDLSLSMRLNFDALNFGDLFPRIFVLELVSTFIFTTHLIAERPELQLFILEAFIECHMCLTPQDLLFHEVQNFLLFQKYGGGFFAELADQVLKLRSNPQQIPHVRGFNRLLIDSIENLDNMLFKLGLAQALFVLDHRMNNVSGNKAENILIVVIVVN